MCLGFMGSALSSILLRVHAVKGGFLLTFEAFVKSEPPQGRNP